MSSMITAGDSDNYERMVLFLFLSLCVSLGAREPNQCRASFPFAKLSVLLVLAMCATVSTVSIADSTKRQNVGLM